MCCGREQLIGILTCLVVGVVGVGCEAPEPPPVPSAADTPSPTSPAKGFDFQPHTDAPGKSTSESTGQTQQFEFTDVAAELGITHVYHNGAQGRLLMVESLGGGCGWLDYDADDLIDVYLAQGGKPDRAPGTQQAPNRLYRNRDPDFVDVTQSAYVDDLEYSHGVAVGDFDNDGFDDMYVTAAGRNTLYHNLGDGTFSEATDQTGTQDTRWSSSAAWGDLDQDGDLDLYVCNYCKYDPQNPVPCLREDQSPGMCNPRGLEAFRDECFENLGNGQFRRISQASGLFGAQNKALGVVIADLNNDGLCDVYVANDTAANFLFLNQGDFKFQERATLLGGALSADGRAQASMGIALGDYDQNQYLDLYCTHFSEEGNTLYQNLGAAGFQDVTGLTGLMQPTYPKLAFGTVMQDFNLDTHLDLLVANGHIDDQRTRGEGYRMNPQLFTFDHPKWREETATAGDYFAQRLVGRGVATADFDRDGDLDALVVHQNLPVALLRSDHPPQNWLQFRFTGRQSNRRGVGVRVQLAVGDQTYLQELAGGTSYLSSHEPVLTFGLGAFAGRCRARVTWPSGTIQELNQIDVNQRMTLLEPAPSN